MPEGDLRHLAQIIRPGDLPQEVVGVGDVGLDLQPLVGVQAPLGNGQEVELVPGEVRHDLARHGLEGSAGDLVEDVR